jgi:Glycosyltransferase 61
MQTANRALQRHSLHTQPIAHKLFSFTGTAIEAIEDACAESWVVEPSLTQSVQPSIYLPGDLDRVTGAIEFSTLPREMESLTAEVRVHAATTAFRLRNVVVAEGGLYSGRWRERLMTRERAEADNGSEKRMKSGVVACSWCGNHFFGHWITDDLTLHLAAEEIGHPFILKRKSYLHEPGYRRLLSIWCDQVASMRFGEVVVLRDFGQNAYKKKRYEVLRNRLKQQFRPVQARRVLLRRGSLGVSRDIVNNSEFESFLIRHGFTVVDPEKLTPSEIVEQTMGAEVVMGVEGSQIPHALLTMAERGILCCLQPPFRFANTFKGYTDCLGMRYAMLVGHAAPGGFRIDLNDLGRILEKIDTELARL